MVDPLEMKIIVASEDDLRRIVREEIAKSQTQVVVVKTADFGGAIMKAAGVTFRPRDGSPTRELKTQTPPQDGGQALEP